MSKHLHFTGEKNMKLFVSGLWVLGVLFSQALSAGTVFDVETVSDTGAKRQGAIYVQNGKLTGIQRTILGVGTLGIWLTVLTTYMKFVKNYKKLGLLLTVLLEMGIWLLSVHRTGFLLSCYSKVSR